MSKTVPVHSDAAPTAAGRPSPAAAPGSLPHLRGIDGLRAIAVLAVVAYHAGIAILPGGFLGVEVFFVISGYLITGLLLAEHRATGRIDLVRFWLRRARRLLPALFFLLATTLAVAVVLLPDELARLRADAVAAFAYVTNWHLIVGEQSYFESTGRPSLLVHLWSLAIEEQFYLFWPVLLALALLIGRRTALALTLVAAAASTGWMALQFDPLSDPSRVYYGTDTRLTGLLLGAALAFVWVPSVAAVPTLRPGMSRRKRRQTAATVAAARHWGSRPLGWALDIIGVAGLVAMVAFFVAADAFAPFLYQGGLALLAVVTAVVIAAAVHPRGHLGRLLDVAPMRWLGTRSYSVYLWHWPIFAVTRPGLDVPIDEGATLALRLALTAVLAEVSYRFVESPFRRHGLRRLLPGPRSGDEPAGRARRWPNPALAGGLAAILSVVLVSVAIATPPALPDGLRTTSIDEVVVDASALPVDQPPTPDTIVQAAARLRPASVDGKRRATAGAPSHGGHGSQAEASTTRPGPTPPPTPTPTRSILAFGESVMIQGAEALAKDLGPVRVDAAVGRHIYEGIEILERRAAEGTIADTVIVQLGNNGPFRAGQFDAVMSALDSATLVVWVNVRVPRDWEAHNNRMIASGVSKYPKARLVDWYAATEGRPELFYRDGYHPRPKGAKLYADLIAEAVR